jgi:hypothetical protein
MSAAATIAVIVPADERAQLFSATRWQVDERGYLSIYGEDEVEVATFHPQGWMRVFLLDALGAS